MDIVDLAQANEEADREAALARVRARAASGYTPRAPALAALCVDCDGPIEPKRLTALQGRTNRCAHCARFSERKEHSR